MKKETKQLTVKDEMTDFLLYTSPNGEIKVETIVHKENIWLNQKMLAELFGCSKDNISLHLKNIFNGGELDKMSVVEDFSVTAADGKKYSTMHNRL